MTQRCVLTARWNLFQTLLLPCIGDRGWIRLLIWLEVHLTNIAIFQQPTAPREHRSRRRGGRAEQALLELLHLNQLRSTAESHSRKQSMRGCWSCEELGPWLSLYAHYTKWMEQKTEESCIYAHKYLSAELRESAPDVCFWSHWKAQGDEKQKVTIIWLAV